MTDAPKQVPTNAQIYETAVIWCGRKDRETFPEDIAYFVNMWSSLPGLKAVVDEVMNADEKQ
jgi:hypothetical protein